MSQFGQRIERRGSGSFKWDGNGRMFGRDDLLPFWVADMDFATPAPIIEAVRRRLEHPVFGYEERQPEYVAAVHGWLTRRHDWDVPQEWLMFCPPSSIVAIYGLITGLTEPGDGVIVPVPTYGPLIDLVRNNGRELQASPLVERDGRFTLDIDGMQSLVGPRTKMLITCNPHNPTGRVFTHEELDALAEFASRHELVVVSDEVHADLVRPGHRHVPFGSLGYRRSATVMSPNKTFNTAGLPQASLVIPDAAMRGVLQQYLDTAQVNHDSTFGAVAMLAAYRDCEDWLDELITYIDRNHARVAAFIDAEVPGVRVWPAEGTYLAWLDYRETGLSEKAIQQRLVEQGGVALYSGTLFGEAGRGFLRMNVACPRETLEAGLEGIRKAFPS